MKHLKLFESFGLSKEDIKDLLQDTIDEFNLRPANYSDNSSLVDTYLIKSYSNDEVEGEGVVGVEVKIYVLFSTHNWFKYNNYISDFRSRLSVMGYTEIIKKYYKINAEGLC